MTDVLEYSIPVFHPIAVHFPVALLPVAAIICVAWFVRGNESWGAALAVILAAAAIGSIVAFVTGETVYGQSEGVPVVEQFVERHRNLGRLVMIGAIISFVLSIFSLFFERKKPDSTLAGRMRLACLALVFICTALVLLTAHLGGIMVWGEYVGQ